ncbi:MAG: PAS domain-containing protein [Acidobacteriia bacterium]|nr:PAS domain-containing protein [Terriglobia bacterium]
MISDMLFRGWELALSGSLAVPALSGTLFHPGNASSLDAGTIVLLVLVAVGLVVLMWLVERRIDAPNESTGRWDGELEKVQKDGTKLMVRTVIVPFRNEHGRQIGTIGVSRDISERKRAEDQLRQSEADLAEAQRLAKIGNWSFDLVTHAVTWSQGLCRIFEVESAEFGGTYGSFLSRVHPDDKAHVLDTNEKALVSGEQFEMEYRIVPQVGRVKNIREIGYVTKDRQGRPVRLFGTAQDITERKRAEEALRAGEARLREYERVVEGLDEMIVVVDREYRYVLANRAFLKYHGMESKQLAGRLAAEVLKPSVFETVVKEKLDECLRGKIVNYEMTYDYPHLGMRDLFISYFPILGGSGVERVACVLQDKTERKRAQQTLQEWQQRMKLAEDAGLRIGFWDWDMNANTVIWSAETYRQYGFTQDTFSGRFGDAISRIHPEDQIKVEEAIQRVLAGGSEYAAQYRVVRPDQTTCWIDAHGVAVREGSTHMLGIGIDITNLKKTEESLQAAEISLARANRIMTVGELGASIAHEVNQPLAAVVTNGGACLRWLALQPPNLNEARAAVTRMIQEANRASDIITKIRAMLANAAPEMTFLGVNQVILRTLALARSELDSIGITVRTELAADPLMVMGDRIQLKQVLLNLILNGIDAMSMVDAGERALLIRSSRGHECVVIQVRDSGRGVDPDQAERIFEPFFTTKHDGMGLGLSISRSIVEAHGGRIWVAPGSPSGAVFTFTLPPAGREA